MHEMTALEAFRRVERAARILAWGWMLNNLLGLGSTGLLIYLIWWQWKLGIVAGVFVVLAGIWIINTFVLPTVFRIANQPFAEMARTGAVRLAVLNVIDEETVRHLADVQVEKWPHIIASSMTAEEFQERVLGC